VKDPNAPKKVRAPRKKKEVVVSDKIDFESVSENPNAIHILGFSDKIDWRALSENPNAIHILEVKPEVVVPEVVVEQVVVSEPVVTTPVMEEKKKEKVLVKKAKKTTKVLVDVPSEN